MSMIRVIAETADFVIVTSQKIVSRRTDRDRDVQRSPNARNTVERFVMPVSSADRYIHDSRRLGPLWPL